MSRTTGSSRLNPFSSRCKQIFALFKSSKNTSKFFMLQESTIFCTCLHPPISSNFSFIESVIFVSVVTSSATVHPLSLILFKTENKNLPSFVIKSVGLSIESSIRSMSPARHPITLPSISLLLCSSFSSYLSQIPIIKSLLLIAIYTTSSSRAFNPLRFFFLETVGS